MTFTVLGITVHKIGSLGLLTHFFGPTKVTGRAQKQAENQRKMGISYGLSAPSDLKMSDRDPEFEIL